ncbi:MAG: Ig-like domain-containing protein [Pseudomonadota bacterium]
MKNNLCWFAFLLFSIILLSSCGGGGSSGGGVPADAVSVNDLDGTTSVARNAVFAYTFSEAVTAATVTASTFFIVEGAPQGQPGNGQNASSSAKAAYDAQTCDAQYALAGTVDCPTSTACTLTPTSELKYNMQYSVCLLDTIELSSGTAFDGAAAAFMTVGSENAFQNPAPEELTFAAFSNNTASAGFATTGNAYLIQGLGNGTFYDLNATQFDLYYTAPANTIDLLQTFSTEVLSDNAYIIGGLKNDGNLCEVPSGGFYNCATTDTWVYDPAQNTLTQGTPINNARDVAASGVVDGRIYLIGGWNPNANDTNLSSVEVFDGTSWSEVNYEGRFIPTRSSAYAVVGKKVYVIAGCAEFQGCQQTLVQIFDTETNTFSRGADMSLPGRHFSGQHAVARQGRYIYVYGGATDMSATKFKDIAVYDVEANEWQTLTNTMTVERKSVGSAMLGDKLYVAGGGENTTEVGTFTAAQ